MKQFNLLLVFLLAAGFSYGQYTLDEHNYSPAPGNPDELHTTVEQPAPTGWTNLYTGGTTTMTWSSTVSMPFSFSFAGTPVTDFKVSNTGVLTFDVGTSLAAPDTVALSLPNATIPDMSVCMWGLKGSGANDQIDYRVFGTTPNRQLWVYFSSFDGPGTVSGCWYYGSIVLEETSNSIFVVDQRQYQDASLCPYNLTIGVQQNSSMAVQQSASPNYSSMSQDNPEHTDNVWYEFRSGPMAGENLTAYNISNYEYMKRGDAPFMIEGEFINHGPSTVTSMDINYQVDAGAIITNNITGLSIAPGNTDAVAATTGWTPPAEGQYQVKVWASNINGGPDGYPRWDETEKTFLVYDTSVEHEVLIEMFTSSTCPPCVPANANLKPALVAQADHITCIKYQMDWPGSGDIYYTTEGGARRTPYNVTSVPSVFFDGKPINAGGTASSTLGAILEAEALQIPAFLDFDASYAIDSPGITINVNLDAYYDIGSGYKLHVGVVERETTGNVGTNGETSFEFVMMDLIPTSGGENLPNITKGYSDNFSYNVGLGGTNVEEWDDLMVVAWVAHPTTLHVANSSWAYDLNTAIDNPIALVPHLNIYPNPTSNSATLEFELDASANSSARLLGLIGQELEAVDFGTLSSGSHSHQFDVSHLSKGMYFIELTVNGEQVVRSLSVK